jgi:hypothetical protein
MEIDLKAIATALPETAGVVVWINDYPADCGQPGGSAYHHFVIDLLASVRLELFLTPVACAEGRRLYV